MNSESNSDPSSTPVGAFPTLDADLTLDVAILGDGLAALLTALSLHKSGQRVALLAPGRLLPDRNEPLADYAAITEPTQPTRWLGELDLRRATLVAEAHRQAVRQMQVLAAQVSDCDFTPIPILAVAEYADDLLAVERRCAMSRALRGDSWFTHDVQLPFVCAGASREEAHARLRLPPLLTALAAELQMLGGKIFENSPCVDPTKLDGGQTILFEQGRVRCDRVLICGRIPHAGRAELDARLLSLHAYHLAARVMQPLPDAIFTMKENPTRTFWRAEKGNPTKVIFRAEYLGDQPGRQSLKFDELACFAASRFSIRGVDAKWSHHQLIAPDGLPLVGPMPQSERLFLLAGSPHQGLPWAMTCAEVAVDLILGRQSQWGEIFTPGRLLQLREGVPHAARSPRTAAFDSSSASSSLLRNRSAILSSPALSPFPSSDTSPTAAPVYSPLTYPYAAKERDLRRRY